MNDTEKIPVYVRIKDGKTICVCHASHPRCDGQCERDMVTRDRFRGWQSTMRRNRYGQ